MMINNVLMERFFKKYNCHSLLKRCHSHMLWEAVDACDAELISIAQAIHIIEAHNSVLYFPEPFLFLVSDREIPIFRGNAKELEPLFKMREYSRDTLYILAEDYSWLIIFTREHENGKELIVFIK